MRFCAPHARNLIFNFLKTQTNSLNLCFANPVFIFNAKKLKLRPGRAIDSTKVE